MRLIDADKLIYKLNNELGWEETRRLQTMIMEQPTAYDVDKVVEKLEKLKTIRSMKDYASTGIIHDYADTKEAIEIVKGGGIDE